MFFPVLMFQSVGGSLSGHTALRSGVRPHIGQSAARAIAGMPAITSAPHRTAARETARKPRINEIRFAFFLMNSLAELLRIVRGHDDVVVVDFQVVGEAP